MQVINVKNKYKSYLDLKVIVSPFNMFHVIFETNSAMNDAQIRDKLSEIAYDIYDYGYLILAYETKVKHVFLEEVRKYIHDTHC